ncbi:MAG: class I SAM-dependent methyltransferase [Wenzhouxiangellaceae bacterium]|nr:class I SAM-dependent methyltransferase [Wenzhouxiangellaceae bacterium]
MSNRSIGLDDRVLGFLREVSLRETPLLRELRERTLAMPEANMQIAPEQGQFMALLARLIGARHYLEIGTFTGYSALAVAQALPESGRAICVDRSEEWTSIAETFWIRAGINDRMDLRIGEAAEILQRLLSEGRSGDFDLAFIDADKAGTIEYYERCLELVRRGGLIMVDNTLWDGRVADPDADDEDTEAMRAFDRHVATDERVDLSLVPIGDGLTLLRKRG